MSISQKQEFHVVDLSPWPIITCISLIILLPGFVMLMHDNHHGKYPTIFGFGILIFCLYSWWNDIIKEGKSNLYTERVSNGLKIGMIIFILSELMLFFGIFFAYFFSKIFPVGILNGIWVSEAGIWPPKNIIPLDPWDIPFLNTLILLLSSTTLNWADYAISRDQKESQKALLITILLGITFTMLQIYEYHHATFKITDGIYASNFYLATAVHGVHVIIGTIFLSVCYFRTKNGDFLIGPRLGYSFASWYWHFVDVIWICLFIFIYIFGR